MDRRSFLTAVGAGLAVIGAPLGACSSSGDDSNPSAEVAAPTSERTSAATPEPTPLWAANFRDARDSRDAGFGNVQTQQGDGEIENNGAPIPVVDHPELGPALKLTLLKNGERLEAEPGGGQNLGEGDEYFFRVDFALADDFPLGQQNPFCLINQVHQVSNSGSPPVEFDVHDDALFVRGNSDAYNERLVPLSIRLKYSLVYRLVLSARAQRSRIEVWVDGQTVLADYTPACPLRVGGDSYWKGATVYCDPEIPPLTVYQNAHRVGRTYESVAS